MEKSKFNITNQELFMLIDEAWMKRGLPHSDDLGVYVIDMGKIIGTAGETAIKIITRPNTFNLLTAYPVKKDCTDIRTKLEIFKGKVVCPRCNDGGGGFIYKAELNPIQKTTYICNECDGLWEQSDQISKIPFMDFGKYAEKHGYTYETIDIKTMDYHWYKPDQTA